jgi:hypothetical protein
MGDIQLILEGAIQSEMGIKPSEIANYNAVFVIPDLFDKSYVNEMTRMLFQDMGFSKVAFMQVRDFTVLFNIRNRCVQHSELVSHMLVLSTLVLKRRP